MRLIYEQIMNFMEETRNLSS